MSLGKLWEKIMKLGWVGLFVYGLFNGIIYIMFFFIVFLVFEKSMG